MRTLVLSLLVAAGFVAFAAAPALACPMHQPAQSVKVDTHTADSTPADQARETARN